MFKSFITYENISLTIQTLMMLATFMAAFIALNQLKLSQNNILSVSTVLVALLIVLVVYLVNSRFLLEI